MTKEDQRLIEVHRQHLGLYAKVANRLGVSASLVSLVVAGKRYNEAILGELLRELRKLR